MVLWELVRASKYKFSYYEFDRSSTITIVTRQMIMNMILTSNYIQSSMRLIYKEPSSNG